MEENKLKLIDENNQPIEVEVLDVFTLPDYPLLIELRKLKSRKK